MLFPSILLSIFIFNISLINSQQQKQRITINQSQKSEPKVKGSVGVTILLKKDFTHNGKNHVANFSEASNYNGTLFINDVYIDHAGQWTCHVKTKEHGLVYGTITVYIRPVVLSNTRLRIYNIPDQNFQFEGSSITVIRGNDVHLTCPVYGNPRPQIVWMKGAQDLKDERMKVDNNGTLFIQNVTYLDQGMYTCKAVNTFADRFSSVNKKIQSTVSIERHLRIKSEFAWLLPLGIIILLVFLLLFIIVLCEMRKRRKEQKQLISVNSGADDD
uniref:Ig-like domain-containing protein n=1 Tax=Meloidogyne hapla TaxID=6305 RepID=A0A1I8BWE9_MELHA